MLVKELKELSNLSEDLGKNLNLIQGAGGNTSVKIDEVLWVKASGYWLSDALALDKETIKAISYRSLYPDHVVFLGPGPMTVVNMEKANKLVSNDIGKHNAVVIENIGVIVHQASSENIDGMLHCLANTLLRVQPNEKLSYLSEQDELELLDWNAEEYRQSIQKKRV